LQIYGKHQRKQ